MGKNFSNSCIKNKKDQIFELIKDVENNIYKIEENEREELRHVLINESKKFLSQRYKMSEFDLSISRIHNKTKE